MKLLTVCALILAPTLALAQAPKPQATAAKTVAKPATKSATKTTVKTAAPKVAVAKATPRQGLKKAAPAAAGAGIAAAAFAAQPAVLGTALSPEDMAIAQQVHTGRIACELGAFVSVDADEHNPGRFHVSGKGFRYHMQPVASRTGSVRLEDTKAGAVWLQIANKSMLMNHKQGQRMADECMSDQQQQVAQAIKLNPPQSLFEPLPAGR